MSSKQERKKPKIRKPTTLSFRVEAEIGRRLLTEARAENVSIHEVSRQRLLRSFAEQSLRDELLEIREVLQHLFELVQDLRDTDDSLEGEEETYEVEEEEERGSFW